MALLLRCIFKNAGKPLLLAWMCLICWHVALRWTRQMDTRVWTVGTWRWVIVIAAPQAEECAPVMKCDDAERWYLCSPCAYITKLHSESLIINTHFNLLLSLSHTCTLFTALKHTQGSGLSPKSNGSMFSEHVKNYIIFRSWIQAITETKNIQTLSISPIFLTVCSPIVYVCCLFLCKNKKK